MSFDLSSTSSSTSDDGSVVDISELLPDKTKKGVSSLLFDFPSTFDHNVKNTDRQNDGTRDENDSDVKLNASASAKRSLEYSDKEDGRGTIRVVMGESVKNWRRQRQNNPRRTPTTARKSKGSIVQPDSYDQPSYILVQQRDASTEPKTSENETTDAIDFEKSRLEVQQSVSGIFPRVDLVEALPTSKERRYTAKTVKRQFSQHGNQTTPSAFVDCIAIWDAERQVYRLEIPELVASDLRFASLSVDEGSAADSNVGSSKQNPLQQQQQAEAQLLQSRKKRRLESMRKEK